MHDINGKTQTLWNDTDASKTYDEMREKLNGLCWMTVRTMPMAIQARMIYTALIL